MSLQLQKPHEGIKRVSHISQALEAIREKDVAKHVEDSEGFSIRPMYTELELDQIYKLTHDAYVERGYCEPQPGGKLIHYPHLDHIPETTILVAALVYLKATRDLRDAAERIEAEGKKGLKKTLQALEMTLKAVESGGAYTWTLQWDDEKGEATFNQIVKIGEVLRDD